MVDEVLDELQTVADVVGVQMLVVGATARDMVMASLQGGPPSRRTEDVDIAVRVSGWDAYEQLVSRLQRMQVDPEHRFRVLGVAVDVVPFGGVEDEHRSLTWPRGGEHLTVLGFREALDSAVEFPVRHGAPGSPGTMVKVASLPAQSVLKLLAFDDRWPLTTKDAIDFRELALAYSMPSQVAHVAYAEENGRLLDQYDYEVEPVGAHVLGTQAADLLGRWELRVVQDLVDRHLHSEGESSFLQRMGGRLASSRALVEAYLAGLQQGRHAARNDGEQGRTASRQHKAQRRDCGWDISQPL